MKYSALVALLLGVGTVSAGVFPTVPDGSAIFTPNQQVTIQWKDDGKAPSLGKMGTIQVDFMTGADLQQTTLDPLGTPEAASGKLAWVVPQVEPAGKYYFLKFTSVSNNELVYFTTRFTITDTNGKYPPEDDPPPAVGKNLGKVGKIIAKGDPDGPVPKTVGKDPSLNDPGTPEPTGTPDPTGTPGTAGTPEPSGTPEPTGTQTTGTPETPEAPETSDTPDTPEYPGAKGNGQVKESDSKDTNAPTDTSSAFDASKTGSNMANDAGSINNQIYGGLIGLTLVCSLFSIFF